MRIIAGEFGGQRLRSLPGAQTRPTADRVREAWASSVGSLRGGGFSDARVLDAFAGSGALGLEALSRGADSIVFIERSKEACRVIAANISSLILDEAGAERVKLIQADALMPGTIDQLVKGAPFDLVFLDPPYAMKMNRISELLQRLADSGLLAPDCLICYECAQSPSQSSAAANSAATKHGKSNRGDGGAERDSKDPSIVVNGLNMISCKRYGTTNLEYYRLRSPHDLQE